MVARFYGINKVYSASLTGTNVNAQFPLANLQDDRSTKVYRSTTNSDSIVLDFGSTIDIDAVCFTPNLLSGFGVNAITVELNASNSWGSPSVTQAITIDAAFKWASYEWATTQKYRYAKITLGSALAYCELSNIYFGVVKTPGNLDFSYPLSFRENQLGNFSENRYGQKFIDTIVRQKELKGKMENLYPSELESMLDWIDTISTTKPIFLKFDSSTIFSDANRINGRYYLKSIPTMSFEAGGFWSLSFDFEEAM